MCSCSIFCIKCLKFVFVEINEMCGIQFSSFFAFFPRGCSNKGEVMVMIKGKSLVNSKMHSGKQLIRLIKAAIGKIYLKLNSHSQARSKHSLVKLNNIAGRLNHYLFEFLVFAALFGQNGASKYQPFVQFNFPMYETKNWQQMEGNQSLNQTTNSCLPLGIQMVSTTYQRQKLTRLTYFASQSFGSG